MIIFPAIDILDGNSVRLINGDYNRVKVYGTPVEIGKRWEKEGAEFLHIVDLNGARGEIRKNSGTIEELVRNSNCRLQLGGGIRSMSDIEYYLNSGIERVILGSVCIEKPEIVREAIKTYGSSRIVCGIDAMDGFVAVNGWLKKTKATIEDVCLHMRDLGAEILICTDISRDGVMSGVNADEIDLLLRLTGLKIIASGGINSRDDIIKLKQCGAYGAIVGTALYENKMSLKDLLESAKG